MVGRKMLVMIISYTGTPCSASPLPQPGIQRQGTSLPETPDGKDHPQSKLGPHWATHSWGASRGSLAWAGSQLHLPPPGTQTSAPAPWHLEEGWDTSRPPSQPERAPCSRCPTARSNGSPGVALAAGETDTVTTCELAWPVQRGVGESSWCLGLPAPEACLHCRSAGRPCLAPALALLMHFIFCSFLSRGAHVLFPDLH